MTLVDKVENNIKLQFLLMTRLYRKLKGLSPQPLHVAQTPLSFSLGLNLRLKMSLMQEF